MLATLPLLLASTLPPSPAALLRLRGGDATLLQQLHQLRETIAVDPGLVAADDELRLRLEELRGSLRATIDAPDDHGLSRLHCAVIEQDDERCETLLQAGANPDVAAGSIRVRPLHLAVLAGDERTECLQRLLRAGAAPDARDARGTTSLHAAAALNLPHSASLLLEHGASPNLRGARGVRPLQLSGWVNAAEAAQVLLDAGAKVDAADNSGRSACHAAAASDSAEVLEVLCDGGTNAERRDARGWTPLHYAVRACRCADPRCGRTRALSFLLEAQRCAVMPRDKAGWTPLHVAAEHERIASVAQLLRCERCEVDAPGPNGCTPLMLAAHAGSRKCAAALLAAGASLDRRDGGGATALLAAAAGRRAKAMRLLLQAGADPHCRDSSGSGAAFFAAKGGSAACVRLLREHGVELATQNDFGWSALHAAANSSHVEALSALCEAGVTSRPDAYGWTPLMIATHRIGEPGCRCRACVKRRARSLQCMRVLLREGAPGTCDAADRQGATAAHLAAAHDSAAALRLLREHGADLWRRDRAGHTPLQVARSVRQPSQAARVLLMMDGGGGGGGGGGVDTDGDGGE